MMYLKRCMGFVLMGGCLVLQGCHSVKTTLGIEREPPDEFAVLPNSQPLDMPPDFRELPIPRPGAPRPQEVKAMKQRKQKSFGGNVLSGGQSSPGQEALLKLGGLEHKQEDIRREIDEEHHRQVAKDKNVLRETLGFTESNRDALEPLEEVKKLEEQGIHSGNHNQRKLNQKNQGMSQKQPPAPLP